MRSFITGIAGFAGSHLADHLLSLGHEVSGLILPAEPRGNLDHLEGRIALHTGDICDKENLRRLLHEIGPDYVFHLAALSAIGTSWEEPSRIMEVNTLGGAHLLEACLPIKEKTRIVLISSAAIYGTAQPGSAITEEAPPAPANPYAVSKLALDLLAGQYAQAQGLDLVRMRPANHTGPRQGAGFVFPDFADQIAKIEAGEQEPVIRVGNLDSLRDFTDVRDVVRAYTLAAERGASGAAYLICSGRPQKISDALETLLSLSTTSIQIERDPSKYRPTDPPQSFLPSKKFAEATGWKPKVPFSDTLRDILEFWRGR